MAFQPRFRGPLSFQPVAKDREGARAARLVAGKGSMLHLHKITSLPECCPEEGRGTQGRSVAVTVG